MTDDRYCGAFITVPKDKKVFNRLTVNSNSNFNGEETP
jgi:hypothetical protein